MRTTLLLLAALSLTTACTLEDGEVGPCVHRYVGPVLVLEQATVDGRPVAQVKILSVREGKHPFDVADASDSLESTGLEVDPAGRVTCTLPCGFGEAPGRWWVTVGGPNGSTGAVDTRARYHAGGGSCPSYSSDGSEVSVILR